MQTRQQYTNNLIKTAKTNLIKARNAARPVTARKYASTGLQALNQMPNCTGNDESLELANQLRSFFRK